MNTGCQQIDSILKLVENEGNSIVDVSKWTKIDKVIQMRAPLTSNLREKIKLEIKGLEYRKVERTPFDPAHETFACLECSIAIEFPSR